LEPSGVGAEWSASSPASRPGLSEPIPGSSSPVSKAAAPRTLPAALRRARSSREPHQGMEQPSRG
jgi:hypothetical protein